MEQNEARKLLGTSFIGRDELAGIDGALAFSLPESLRPIPFSAGELESVRDTHVLCWCPERFADGSPVTIRTLREKMSGLSSPRFYNQDWYLHERFLDRPLEPHWSLVPKEISQSSRGLEPGEITKRYTLRPAVELTYLFFVCFLINGEMLWKHDYVWCEDEDDKGDRIYVGRYVDASGLNEDGFEIHRHLRIKPNYGAF